MWRRSVSRRSPPTSASTRSGRPPTLAASSTAARPRGREELDPRAQGVGDLVGDVVAAGVELGGGVAEEAGERGRAHPGAAVRLLQRLEERQPLDRGRRREDTATAGDHGRDTDLEQRLADGGQVGVAIADHRDVARPDRLAVEGGARGEQAAYVEGEILRDVRAHLSDRERRVAAPVEGVAPHHPHPERRCGRRADEPALLVVGGRRRGPRSGRRRARRRRAAAGRSRAADGRCAS